MAGYFLYSLDYDKLARFMAAPSGKPLTKMAEMVSDALDDCDDELEDGDPEAEWPIDPKELEPILKSRIALDDWYADLSDVGQRIWERAFTGLCSEKKLFGFECECDGIYWNIVSEALKFHGFRGNTIKELELTHFGTRPLRYLKRGKISYDKWYPYHSMHTPDEVRELINQFTAAEKTILNSRHKEVAADYEALMPVLQNVSASNRVLYVSVDT